MMVRILAALTLVAALGAYNTVQGIGRDLGAGGRVIENAADRARPRPVAVQQPYYY